MTVPIAIVVKGLFSLLISIVLIIVLAYLALFILKLLLVLGAKLIDTVGYRLIFILAAPFYFLNWLQRWLAKPWRIFLRSNRRSDLANWRWRHILNGLKVPLYLLLAPLRLLNACYYNLLVHCAFEMFDYCIEVLNPANPKEGAGSLWRWIAFLPWRIIRYPLWHGALTVVESTIWTMIDTFVPALTLFHGTTHEAGRTITQCRGRVGNYSRKTEVWNVGSGNFAGNGIYFAPARSTAIHYAGGALIVCRVSLGRVLDMGLAPGRIYRQCGHPDATGATRWGLEHGFTTGEWWRKDTGWWEYCMYDWQNRYNESFRIRPLYVLDLDRHFLLHTPGGMHHWLFRRLVWDDMTAFFKRQWRPSR